VRVAGEDVALRVSVLPTRVGEKVVMRLLNEKSVQVSMGTLGFMPEVLERFKALLNREQGILLVTGPTGSGKTVVAEYAVAKALDEGGALLILQVDETAAFRVRELLEEDTRSDWTISLPPQLAERTERA